MKSVEAMDILCVGIAKGSIGKIVLSVKAMVKIMTTLFDLIPTDLDGLYDRSILIGEDGPDIGWYIVPSPTGEWIAWDDANPTNPGYEIFPTKEAAIAAQHAGYRAAYPEQFETVKWVSVNQITGYRIAPPAMRWRIREGKWPMGHARWMQYPTTSRWEVTQESLEE